MPRPRREEFILDVRLAARLLLKPNVEADWTAVDTDGVAKNLHRAVSWLTPKVVEQYDPDDFAAWGEVEQRGRLKRAVEEFRAIVNQVPPDKPATRDQFIEGTRRFRGLIDSLGQMVLDEWKHAIETLEQQGEEWSAEAGWRSRRENKKMSESLIGAYEAPQLLIFAEPNLYVLDPIARFVQGGQGAFDFAIQPSYITTSLYRDDNGNWYVRLDVRNGVSKGKRVKWNKGAFRQCIEELKVLL